MKPTRPSTLFYFIFTGMELNYLFILASLMGGPVYTLVLILILYPLAFLFRLIPHSTIMHRISFSLELALVILVILLVAGERLLSTLAIGQVDFFGIVVRMGFCGLTWSLGHTVPREQVNFSTIAFRLQIGILAVLLFSQVADNAPLVFLFFLLAPLAFLLARWASSSSRGATVLRSPNLSHLLLAGASVIVPGVALILLLSPEVARAIVNWLWNVLMKWEPPQTAAPAPYTGFKFDLSCMRQEQAVPPDSFMPPTPSDDPAGISPVVIWIIVLVIFLAMVAVIALALRRWQGRRTARPAEPVQFQLRMVSLGVLRSLLYFFPQLLRMLWLWLVSLFQKWRKHPKQSEEPLISMRALYRNLLRWADKQGIARLPSQTPLEHLKLLEHKFPRQQDDLKQVTEGYLLDRYSPKPVSQEDFERIKKAWQRTMTYHTP